MVKFTHKISTEKKSHENGIKKLHASIHVYFTCMQHTYKRMMKKLNFLF